jgi:hypothetical protein
VLFEGVEILKCCVATQPFDLLTSGLSLICWFNDLQAAWHNEPLLTCFGKGRNIVPTIHVRDLAALVSVQCSEPH